jgi:uncharacterized protein involved in exopolysaccharide biosynthesis
MERHEQQTTALQEAVTPAPVHEGRQDEEAIDLSAYLAIFQRRRWVLLGVTAVVVIAGMILAFTRQPLYQSTAKILVTAEQGIGSSEDDIPLLADLKALTRSSSVDTQVEVLSSLDLQELAFSHLSRKQQIAGYGAPQLPEWAVTVARRKNTDVVEITARAYEPEVAAVLANTVASTYFDNSLRRNNQTIRQVASYVDESMNTVREQYLEASMMLARYKQETGMLDPAVQISTAAERLSSLQNDLDAALAEMQASGQAMRALQQRLSKEQAQVITSTNIARNPQYSAILARLDDLQSERAALLQEYTPQSAHVQAVDARIQAEETQLRAVAESITAAHTLASNPIHQDLTHLLIQRMTEQVSGKARVHALRSLLSQRKQEALSLPERERRMADLAQQVELLKNHYLMLAGKANTLEISERAQLPNGRLIARARVPQQHVRPNRAHYALAFLLLGIFAGVLAAVLVDRADHRRRNER